MATSTLTKEQRARIEKNRLAALERRRLHRLKCQSQSTRKQSTNINMRYQDALITIANKNKRKRRFNEIQDGTDGPYKLQFDFNQPQTIPNNTSLSSTDTISDIMDNYNAPPIKRRRIEIQCKHCNNNDHNHQIQNHFKQKKNNNNFLKLRNNENIDVHIIDNKKMTKQEQFNQFRPNNNILNINPANTKHKWDRNKFKNKYHQSQNITNTKNKNEDKKQKHSDCCSTSNNQHKPKLSSSNTITNYFNSKSTKTMPSTSNITNPTSKETQTVKQRDRNRKKKKHTKRVKKLTKRFKKEVNIEIKSHSKPKSKSKSSINIKNNGTWTPTSKSILFNRLSNSKFRSKFKLGQKEIQIIHTKDREILEQHAFDFVRKRLSQQYPKNDGKQTPMRGHPVFIAQHATATCCRTCLSKWHFIPIGVALTDEQIIYMVEVILHWIMLKCPISK